MPEQEPDARQTTDNAWQHPIFEQPVLPDNMTKPTQAAPDPSSPAKPRVIPEKHIVLGEN